MKLYLFGKKPAKSRGRNVIRNAASRAARGEEDYYDAEPNMKLSHAFMVVLILHVVAVGGIYAFNYVKVRQKAPAETVAAASAAPAKPPETASTAPAADEPTAPAVAATAAPAKARDAAVTEASAAIVPVRGDYLPPLASGAAPAGKSAPPPVASTASAPAAPAAPAAAIPATYTVEKGDNPYKIARKFKISYTELLELNGITDPTKLQIGQVLKLPRKSAN